MQLTWQIHACIRIEQDGVTIVVDPGVFTPPGDLDGADALLITHEHGDHFSLPLISAAIAARPGLPIWTNSSVAALLEGSGAEVHTIGDGDTFSVEGIEVQAHGTWHDLIHEELPRVRNTGFLIGGRVFHPGDAMTDPGAPVDLLLVPTNGQSVPNFGDLVDYVRQINPAMVAPIHDTGFDQAGEDGLDQFLAPRAVTHLSPGTGVPYRRLTVGQPITIRPRHHREGAST
jgi:L-ascorbate metabolism protein UlaG (beta-lactamase superfamily)